METIGWKLLVLLTFGCSFGSSGRHSDTLDYVVSIVLELAKAERGVPNCVFYEENNASFHEGFLGQVLRDARLKFVTKTVIRRWIASIENVTLPVEPMVVIIQEARIHVAATKRFTRPSTMTSTGWKLLVLLTLGCSFGFCGIISETLDYVVSIVLELAKAESGVPNCVFYKESNVSNKDGFLEKLLRDPRLEFVAKTVFRRTNFSVENVTLHAEPTVVIIQEVKVDDSMNLVIGLGNTFARTFDNESAKSFSMALEMDQEHAYVCNRNEAWKVLPLYYDPVHRMNRYGMMDQSLGQSPLIRVTKPRTPLMDAFSYTLNCCIESGIYHFWEDTLKRFKAVVK
ncbi:hypothetical protein quinque_015457 [Culex quinquefasciatus]